MFCHFDAVAGLLGLGSTEKPQIDFGFGIPARPEKPQITQIDADNRTFLQARSEKSALIGRATFNNVGTLG